MNHKFKQIKSSLNSSNIVKLPKVIAVSKTFTIEKILPLIEYGHLDFGENKVQEFLHKKNNLTNSTDDICIPCEHANCARGFQSDKINDF